MPQVPVYGGPKVEQAALPNARFTTEAPAEAFGGGKSAAAVAEATKGVAQTFHQVAGEALAEANQVRMLEKRRSLNDWEQANIYNPKTGAKWKTGKNALGVQDELSQSFDKFVGDQEEDLSNDEQRADFRAMAAGRREHVVTWANDHVGQQQKVIQDQEFSASLESSKERGSNDPMNAPVEEDAIKKMVMARAQSQGWDTEQTKQALQQETSDLHARAVSGMLAKNQDIAAQTYFDAVKKGLDPDVATKLGHALEEGSLRAKGQRNTDTITATASNMSDALAEARKITDPKERDETEHRVQSFYSLQAAAKRDEKEKLFADATNIVEKTKSFDKIPPTMLTGLSLSERSGLRNYADTLREGRKPVTDWDKFYNLKTLAAYDGTRSEFLQTNLMEVRPFMADAEFKQLVDLQTGMRKGDEKSDKLLKTFRTEQEIVNSGLNAIGIDPTPKPGTAESTKVNEFRRKVAEQQLLLQEKTQKPASDKDIEKIVDGLVIEGVTQKRWYWTDVKKRVFELGADEQITVPADKLEAVERARGQIPSSEKAKIEDSLRRNGYPVNPQTVQATWLRAQQRPTKGQKG